VAITRNNQQTLNDAGNASSYTLANYVVSSGTDRVLVVRVASQKNTTGTISPTATYGGTSMTLAASDGAASGGNRYHWVGIFYLINPTVGTADIVVTISAGATGCIVAAEVLTGAAQSSLIGATDTDRGNPTNDLALTGCVADSLVLAAVVSDSSTGSSWTWSTATESYDLNNGSNVATDAASSGGHYAVSASGDVTVSATRASAAPVQYGVAVEFKAAAASSISGTLSKTLAGVTLAATGKVAIAGVLSKTLAGVTTTATGKVALTGAVAKTLAGVTLSASGKVAVSGTSAVTLAGATLQATGKAALVGTLAQALAGVTLSSSGTVSLTGVLAQTLGGVTLSATGAVAITGSASITLAGVTLATSGGFGQQSAGELAATLEGVSLVATGVLPITGTVASALGGASLSSTGAVRISGTLAAVLSNLTLSATGQLAESESRTGQLAATLAGVSLDSSGELAIAGVAAISLSPLTLVAAGREPLPPIVVAIGIGLLTRGGMAVATVGSGGIILEGASAELEVIP